MDSMSTSVRVSSKRFITRSRSLDGGWRGDYARGADPCKRSTRPLHPDDSGQDLTWPPNQCDVAAGTSFGEEDCLPLSAADPELPGIARLLTDGLRASNRTSFSIAERRKRRSRECQVRLVF